MFIALSDMLNKQPFGFFCSVLNFSTDA